MTAAGRLFGTDGIRGEANAYPMVPELACALGRAMVRILGRSDGADVLVGTDTRQSADMLACAVASGVCSAGGNALMAGVLPTPGIARVAIESGAKAAVVVSASHNPFTDNGLKCFDDRGFKLSDELEGRIEADIVQRFNDRDGFSPDQGSTVGRVKPMPDAESRYLAFLKTGAPDLRRMRLVLDCANGAGHRVGPRLFRDLGAQVQVLGASPDGRNINEACGSEHPGRLAEAVRSSGADLGIALDGDADRLVAVDETGAVLTGDQIIAVCARQMKLRARLAGNRVVTTVMSNLGLSRALAQMGIEHRTSAVGDRKVLAEMQRCGAVLGGENSGHFVFLDAHTTGDGLYSALRLLEVIEESGRPLSRLKTVMNVYPQVMINVPVAEKPDTGKIPAVAAAIREVEGDFKDRGRVLVRYSGTQPLCRVMVEGPTEAETRTACEKIADAVSSAIGVDR